MTFSTSLTPAALGDYVTRQLNAFYPDADAGNSVRAMISDTLGRLEHCFQHVRIKGFWADTGPRFNHLHTDQNAIFLYYLANTAFRRGEGDLAAKAYALNKALHGLDAFYEVELPEIFALVHPVGTVLGRATYGDYFCAYQNVTVGSEPTGPKPVFGRGVVMYAGSRVIGASKIGDNCLISTGCTVLGGEVPSRHVAFAWQNPETPRRSFATKPTQRDVVREIFQDGA